MKKQLVLICLANLLSICISYGQASNNSTLNNQILCGYQGWFAYPGDGAPINKWKHWFDNDVPPTVENLHIDLYPMMDEYDDADLGESEIQMDGGFARFYSTTKPNVVKKHFEWMKDYGIAGVFHMRFMESIDNPNNHDWKTGVLRNVRDAAQTHGRVFAVSYNIAGTDNSVIDQIKNDWMNLVDNEQITSSGRYLHHNGLPVLRIFGIGFASVDVTDTNALADLIDWFQNTAEAKYRVFLMGGVPSSWRTLDGDSRTGSAWRDIYESLDGIHPWHVGRWSNTSGFESYYSGRISTDADYCNSRGIVYMPTMWPGFSWHNLKDGAEPINSIPRQGGNFMWPQAYRYAQNSNIKTIWMAQFDEVDEGTAIFKVAKDASEVPDEGNWLTLDADGYDLPNDWYLRLCGEAEKMLAGEIPLTSTIPIEPNSGNVSSYNCGRFTVDQTSSSEWKTIYFPDEMSQIPIVVAGPVGFDGNNPATLRIRNVNTTSFQVQVDEWDYLDGSHNPETMYYMAVIPGNHNFGGITAQAGSLTADENWATQSLSQFGTTPVVLATQVTNNGSAATAVRLRNVGASGFEVKVQEEEANDGAHNDETIHFIALSTGTGTFKSRSINLGLTGSSVDENWYTLNFSNSYNDIGFIGNIQTNVGSDPTALRYRNLTGSSVELLAQEEESLDSEVGHYLEVVGWLRIENVSVETTGRIASEVSDNYTAENQVLGIYPNPLNNTLFLHSEQKMQKVSLMDLNGKIKKSVAPGTDHINLNLFELKSGLYILRVMYENGETVFRKLIKQ